MEMTITGGSVLIDEADFEFVSQYAWKVLKNKSVSYATTRVFCKCCKRQSTVYMHRLLLGLEPGGKTIVDHKNHNGLDNRRDNLRACASWQNAHYKRMRKGVEKYSSQYRGVRWVERYRLWEASIKVQGCQRWLGRYDEEKDAALAYDTAARDLVGPFAKLNFPDETRRVVKTPRTRPKTYRKHVNQST